MRKHLGGAATAMILAGFLCFGFHASAQGGATTGSAFPYGAGTNVSQPGLGLTQGLNQIDQNINQQQTGIIKEKSLKELVNGWTSFFLQYYMIVAVGLLIYFGVRLVVSRGAEDERKKLVQAIINLVIGTLIIFLSYVIVNQIVSIVGPSAPAAATTTTTAGAAGAAAGVTSGTDTK